MEKQAIPFFSPIARLASHAWKYGKMPFKFSGLPATVPEGAHLAARQQALATGKEFLGNLKNLQGFAPYGARVKAPASMAAHGADVTNDLLGLRLRAGMGGGYTPEHVSNLVSQLQNAGMDVQGHKMLVRPGYHGWNIKGTVAGTPTEIQLTPRRLQSLSAIDHDALYKPHVLQQPAYMQKALQTTVPVGMNLMSPMSGPGWRAARYGLGGAAAAGTAAGVGAAIG